MCKQLYTIIVILFGFSSLAQSGYLGKTLYIDYMTGVSINPGEHSYGRLSSDELSLWGLTHEVSVHKVVSRKNEIAPFFNYHRTSFGYTDDLTRKMYVSTYGVNLRFFFRSQDSWNVAPIGNYFDFKPFVSRMKLTFVEDNVTDEVPLLRLIAPGVSLGFGRQRVIQGVFTLNYGIQFSVPLSPFSYENTRLTGFGQEFAENAFYRNVIKTVVQVRVGIGFLAH